MNKMGSTVFRVTYTGLEHEAEVTVDGATIGWWIPVSRGVAFGLGDGVAKMVPGAGAEGNAPHPEASVPGGGREPSGRANTDGADRPSVSPPRPAPKPSQIKRGER